MGSAAVVVGLEMALEVALDLGSGAGCLCAVSKDHGASRAFGADSGSGLESSETISGAEGFGRCFLGLNVPYLSMGAPPSRCPASPVPVEELA